MCLANISRKNTNYSLGSLWIRLRYQNTKYSAASHSDFTLPPLTLSGVSTSESTRLGIPLFVVSEARREWPYEGGNQPVLVSERTSTGHLYLPVLVEVVTSTAPRSDQYYFIFICIELLCSSLYEATLMA